MTQMLFLLSIYLLEPVNLVDFGIYKGRVLSVHKVNENYLLTSREDHVILVINNKGEVLSKFDKAGKGPKEIIRPYVVDITESHIQILSDGHRIMYFDHNLQLQKKLERLPSQLSGMSGHGILWKYRLFFPGGRRASHALYEIERTGNKRKIVNSFFKRGFPDNYDPSELREMRLDLTYSCRVQYDKFFIVPFGGSIKDDYYEIHIYATPQKTIDFDKSNMVLSAPIDEFPRYMQNFRVFFRQVGYTGENYVIELNAINPTTNDQSKYFDIFGDRGEFIKRVEAPNKTTSIVRNAREILLIDESSEDKLIAKTLKIEDF